MCTCCSMHELPLPLLLPSARAAAATFAPCKPTALLLAGRRLPLLAPAVTAVDFSKHSPHILGVGMHDGMVAVYDVRSRRPQPLMAATASTGKHADPVWKVCVHACCLAGGLTIAPATASEHDVEASTLPSPLPLLSPLSFTLLPPLHVRARMLAVRCAGWTAVQTVRSCWCPSAQTGGCRRGRLRRAWSTARSSRSSACRGGAWPPFAKFGRGC